MSEPIKKGNLVLWKDGLFRVKGFGLRAKENGEYEQMCRIGDIEVPLSEVRRADWRDETRILKWDYENK